MRKKEFLALCDSAKFGFDEDARGSWGIDVTVMREPDGYMGGNFGIFLNGNWGYTTCQRIESVNNQIDGWRTARTRCEAKMLKYERWLKEWKAKRTDAAVNEPTPDASPKPMGKAAASPSRSR